MLRACVISHSILSPLSFGSGGNFDAVAGGETALKTYDDLYRDVEPFTASRLDDRMLEQAAEAYGIDAEKYTRPERMAIAAAAQAAEGIDGGLSGDETLFILSTTKGNIGLLETDPTDPRLPLWRSAQAIAGFFGNRVPPMVVSSACISGVAAIVAAARIVGAGRYRRVVVAGVDELTRFVVSGFQSFKALSPERCRPFDSGRCGLNLGEGAGAVILEGREDPSGFITIEAGAVTNDANHISGPSRTGEGLFRALAQIGAGEAGFVNAHGTATLYNDEMEAVAFARAGLDKLPVNSFKGCLGHTLGAAGVIESILCMESLRRGAILPSAGYSECGVSVPLDINTDIRQRALREAIKCASGFGGSNAAIRIRRWD